MLQEQAAKGSAEVDVENYKMTVFICNGQFLVWNADDVLKLRQEHHIIGNCIGSLPWKPRQVIQGSLPLRLSKVEAAYLHERGFVSLKDGNEIDKNNFTPSRKQELTLSRMFQTTAQNTILKEQKATELDNLAPTIIRGMAEKHKERVERTADHGDQVGSVKFDTFKEVEINKTFSRLEEHQWLEMPLASSSYDELPTLTNYSFQFGEMEQLMYDVFCDLHHQGFYMTNACKFGGDFLVYPGDPVAYHSFYIAICVPQNKKISGLEYSRYGRLANTVRKTLLICSKNDDGDVDYLSISWTGIAQSEEPKS